MKSLARIWCALWVGCLTLGSVAADENAPEPSGGISATTNGAFVRRHKPGNWSIMGVVATNPTKQDGEATVAAYAGSDVARQFARRVWIPAESRRYAWLPIHIPANISGDRLNLTTLTLDSTGDREILKRRSGDLLTGDLLISLDRDVGKTGTYLRKNLPNDERLILNLDADALRTVVLARQTTHLPSNSTDLTEDFLPPWSDVLQGFDQFVLCSDRIVQDSSGAASLRAWVRDGGRLWIMLDRVHSSTVDVLLGNAVNLRYVDRVELDRYDLESTFDRAEPTREPCEYEEPVEMVRVVTSATDIPCQVQGWPAAIWVPYGEGEVLLTTLGPRGWRPETGDSTTSALRNLSQRLFAGREGRVDVQAFAPALQQQIGYEIPPRSFAFSILGGYCLSLLGLGVVLARRGRLDALAWVVPILTVIATSILVGVGAANATSVRPTIAYTQLVRIAPNTNEARMDGLAAVYDQQSRPVTLRGEHLSWFVPEPSDNADVRRVVWSDNDATETQNVTTLAGSVGFASMVSTLNLAKPIAAVATFGPAGLTGTFSPGDLQDISDPVIVGPPAPALAVALGRDGSFSASPDQMLAEGQYSASALLSDEQRQRQNISRRLFNATDTFDFPRHPQLVFWCRPLATGISLPDGYEPHGSALVVVPLDLHRTPPNSPFTIPSNFLRVDVGQGKQGTSTAYQRRTGQWVRGLSAPTETLLRFQLPDQVLPARLTRGTLTIRINAPSRDLEIWAYGDSDPVLVRSIRNPNGVLNFDLVEDQLLLDDEGRVKIGIFVGETEHQQAERERSEKEYKDLLKSKSSPRDILKSKPADLEAMTEFENSTWQIDYVRFTVSGQTR